MNIRSKSKDIHLTLEFDGHEYSLDSGTTGKSFEDWVSMVFRFAEVLYKTFARDAVRVVNTCSPSESYYLIDNFSMDDKLLEKDNR